MFCSAVRCFQYSAAFWRDTTGLLLPECWGTVNYSSAGFQTNEKSCTRVTLAMLQMYIQSPGAVFSHHPHEWGVCDFVSGINATHTIWASGLHTVIICSQLTADLQRLHPQGVFKNKVLNEYIWTFMFVYLHLRYESSFPVEKESWSRLENHGGTEHNSELPSKLHSHRSSHLFTEIRSSQAITSHKASFLFL